MKSQSIFLIFAYTQEQARFLNETANVVGETVSPYRSNGYNSQVTMAALAYDAAGMDAWIHPVDDLDSTGRVNIRKNESTQSSQ